MVKHLALSAALVALLPWPAAAQESGDPRWGAWLGCWTLVVDDVRDTTADLVPRPSRPTDVPADARPQVCVTRTDGGATFTTRAGDTVLVEETVLADGRDRTFTDDDCRGTRRAEWSRDGFSLFSAAELSCADDRAPRRVSGLAVLTTDGIWTDIQGVEIDDQTAVRVRRYRRTPAGGRTQGRPRAFTIDQVEEAGATVSPAALEAALVETRSSFTLSARTLVNLEDAGVPSSVIDLMVALSYPERFTIERTARTDRVPRSPLIDDPFFLGWSLGYPYWSDAFGYYSPFYGRYSPFMYSPFAYSYLRGYDPWYGGLGTSAIYYGGGGGTPSIQPSGVGRVVNGQGYTRVRDRQAPDSAISGGDGGAASGGSAGSSGSRGGRVSPAGFSSGSSSSSGSSGGSSSSGSSGSPGSGSGSSGGDSGGGRTAQPR